MKKTIVLTLVAASIFQISACAQKLRVMRMENGINKVEHTDPSKDSTKNKVIDASNDFCEKDGKKAVIIDEKTTFSGTFDEKSTNVIRTAGVIGGIFGSQNTADTSAAATNDAKYTTILQFKCE